MPFQSVLTGCLFTVLTLYVAAAGTSFVRGQALLNELRARFPAEYLSNGEPDYLAFGAFGRNFWRPVSASNFFSDRRYATLPDLEFIARADRVRWWQKLAACARWSVCGFVVLIAVLVRG